MRRLGEESYALVLERHHELIRAALAAHGGAEVVTEGDAFFATFASARACVAAAVEVQRSLQSHEWPGGERVRVRMGVHSGEAAQTAAGLVGYDVHRAARVAGVAHGGQVVLSETAAALVRDALPAGAALVDLGFHRLKDLGRPERVSQLSIDGLPSEFPALRSVDNPALLNNLPAVSSSFIGRQLELVEVRGAVESGRLVTLTGAGGAGKTRLALQVAAELLDGAGDGVWLVELASVTDGTQVPAAIGDVLGITVPGEGTLDRLIEALSHQHLLIVLDNCEHLIAACARVADAVLRRCPKVHVLATSREPLGISGEVVYRVPSLSLPDSSDGERGGGIGSDAVALFIDRARAQGAALALDDQDSALVVSVCRRLDGMPLAIELAAARLRSMSLTEVHERLAQRFRLLTGGDRSALPRQQTLRATVQWSYSLMDERERTLLRRLSVFSDGFDLAAAEAVCGFGEIDELDVAELVGSLVDKSLVVAEPAGQLFRYRLLETIRQFAAEHLVEDPAEVLAAELAHLEHFLALAERAMPHLMRRDQGLWRARLDPDQANVRRALAHAAGDPDHTEAALRFAVALRYYWLVGDRRRGMLELLELALRRPEAEAFPELLAGALVTLAFQEDDKRDGLRHAQRSAQIARQLGDDRLLSWALAAVCTLAYFCGESEQGLVHGKEAVERARCVGDDTLLAVALESLLLRPQQLGPETFDALLAEALGCAERAGDWQELAVLHNNAAGDALRRRQFAAARAHLERAQEAEQAQGERPGHVVRCNLGWVLREAGEGDGAQVNFEESLRLCRREGKLPQMSYGLLGLACLAGDRQGWRRAAELHGAGEAFQERARRVWEEPDNSYRQASIEAARAALGEDEFERLYARGKALDFDAAVDLALGPVSGQPLPEPAALRT